MIKVFKGTDTDFTSNGDKIIKPISAIIYKNTEEEYLELEAQLKYKDYLIQDNILIVDTLNGKKGYRIHNPEAEKTVFVKAYLTWQENTPYAADREVVISYGKNLEECSVIEDWDNVVTKLIPVGYRDIRLPEGYLEVESPHQRIYEKTIEFDLSGNLEDVVRQLDDNIAEAESMIATLEKSKENLENAITTYEGAITILEDDLVDLQEQLDNLGDSEPEQIEKAIIEAQIIEIQNQISGLEDEKTDTETALQETIEDLEEARDTLSSSTTYKNNLIIDDLRSQAQTYLNNNTYPQINYELNAHLENTTEIGDTVKVKHERLGIDMLAYVTSYEYNLLTKRYIKVEFGTQKVGIKSYINELESRIYSTEKGVDTVSTLIEQLNDQIVLKIDDNGRIGMFRLGRDDYGTEILIKADNISLEGLTTINEGFKILLDGSFEAVAGEIAGFIVAPEDQLGDGGLIYDDKTGGKFIRISPYSSKDGQGGFNTAYGAIDLGLANDLKNTLIHLRSDGYARFGLVAEGGTSIRFNDFLRHEATGGETGTDTILYSQNFQINRDGTVNIKSDDVTQPIKSIDVTKSDGQISQLDVTFDDSSSASLNVEYSADGDITKVGDTVINY